jgi:hypothetical protein
MNALERCRLSSLDVGASWIALDPLQKSSQHLRADEHGAGARQRPRTVLWGSIMARYSDILSQASQPRSSLVGEVFAFLSQTKKWWLAPIVVCLLGMGLLVFLGGTAAAPFIYTLF